ncbi:hypothetical protein [Flavobacterium sp. GCM10027622]|uniref:hypothetical protein n=1 Tax=unclassified Flavobacterium TaxID=196869 RepID=UPI00361AB554
MKKTVLLALLTMTMVGCKDKENKDGDSTKPSATEQTVTECEVTSSEGFKNLPVDCQNNELIRGLLCAEEQDRVAWLQSNGQKICTQNLYECIEPIHRIKNADTFEVFAGAHPENKVKIKYYEIPWKKIKETLAGVSCYEAYLSFDAATDKLELKKVKDFTTETSCYSLPFLISLEQLYQLKDTDTLYFTKAKVDVTINQQSTAMEKIIFKIGKDNLEAAYYDLSDFPGLLGYYFPIGL